MVWCWWERWCNNKNNISTCPRLVKNNRTDRTELERFSWFVFNIWTKRRYWQKCIIPWMIGMCSKIWGCIGKRRNGLIEFISGVLSFAMEISKSLNCIPPNDGWRSSLKDHILHTSPSPTHWLEMPIIYKFHCKGKNRCSLHQKQPFF